MIFLLVVPIYLLLNVYVFLRTFMWMKSIVKITHHKILGIIYFIIYAFFATSLLSAFLLPQASKLQFLMKFISNYWIGVMLYAIMFIFLSDIIMFILKLKKKKLPFKYPFVAVGSTVIICTTVVSLYGGIHARDVKLKTYDVTIEKPCEPMKICLISDLHLGYSVGTEQMERMVSVINAQKPDLVCVAGDIFDNEYKALEYPDEIAKILASIDSKYGVYGCWGNHDVKETLLGGFSVHSADKDTRAVEFENLMKKANIMMLEDDTVLIDNKFYLVGRLDYEKTGEIGLTRKAIEQLTDSLDKSLPIIEMDHEPNELQEKCEAGVDLDLCGHTHNGQIFPGNLTIRLAWENPCGLLKKGNMYNIVTSGVGVWGPNMRVGTDSEVVIVNVKGHTK